MLLSNLPFVRPNILSLNTVNLATLLKYCSSQSDQESSPAHNEIPPAVMSRARDNRQEADARGFPSLNKR
jgi:hypothetical protein